MASVDEGGDIAVPDFHGKTMRDVTEMCLRLGLEPVLVGSSLATNSTGGGREGEPRRKNHRAIWNAGRSGEGQPRRMRKYQASR